MWLRWLFRRRRPPPPVLLPSLERLAELIERVVELLDEVALAPVREPAATRDPEPDPPSVTASVAPSLMPPVRGHVLLLSFPDGYRLVARDGPPPARGDVLELEGEDFAVLRLGPSPLPGDWRRCACLERQEPPKVDRTFDR
jgi:hypothetical protein